MFYLKTHLTHFVYGFIEPGVVMDHTYNEMKPPTATS